MSIARTASLNVRIEPGAKAEAENVFRSIGISTADAVNIFLKQVARKQAIPFRLEVGDGPQHLNMDEWDNTRLRAEIKAGLESAKTEKLYTEDELLAELKGK